MLKYKILYKFAMIIRGFFMSMCMKTSLDFTFFACKAQVTNKLA